MSYIIDPIGALTSKPYSFVNRPWELRVAETIDFSDDYYSLLNVGVLNNKVQRVLPITRDISNGNTFSTVFGSSWVSDRSRFFFEKYFTNKREYYPFYTSGSITSGLNKYGRSSRLGWFYFVTQASSRFGRFLNRSKIEYNFLDIIDLYSILRFNKFVSLYNQGSYNYDPAINRFIYRSAIRGSYQIFSGGKDLLEVGSDKLLIFLIGYNPYFLDPKLSYYLKVGSDRERFKIFTFMHTYIGAGYRFKNIGFNVKDIVDFFLGRHRYSRYLSSTKSSIVIDYKFLIGNFNSDVIRTVFSSSYSDRIAVVNTINSLRDNYNFVNDISKYFYKNVKTKTDGSWFYKIFINFFDIRNSNLDLNLDKSVEVVDYLGVDYNLVFKPLFLDFSRVLADYLLIKNNCNFKFFEVYGFPILSPLEFEGLYYRYSTKDYSFNNHVSNPVVTNRESRPLGVIIDIINRRINDSVSGQHNSTYMKKFDFILLGSCWFFFFVWFKNEWRLFYKYLSELPICPTIHLFNNFDSSYSNVVDKYYLISKIVTNQIVTPSSSFGVAFGYNCIENYKGDHFHTSYFNQIVGFEGESYSKTLSLVNDSISRKFINFS